MYNVNVNMKCKKCKYKIWVKYCKYWIKCTAIWIFIDKPVKNVFPLEPLWNGTVLLGTTDVNI